MRILLPYAPLVRSLRVVPPDTPVEKHDHFDLALGDRLLRLRDPRRSDADRAAAATCRRARGRSDHASRPAYPAARRAEIGRAARREGECACGGDADSKRPVYWRATRMLSA